MTRVIIVTSAEKALLIESTLEAGQLVEAIRQGKWENSGLPEGLKLNRPRAYRLDNMVVVVSGDLPGLDTRPGPTRRQREVLESLEAGRSGKQVARELGITPRTVDFHIAVLKVELNAVTRVEMMSKARERGWI